VAQKRLTLVQRTREVDHPEPTRSASHLIRPEFTEGVDRETASGKITGPHCESECGTAAARLSDRRDGGVGQPHRNDFMTFSISVSGPEQLLL
jgi:hypothetical protein